MENLKAVLTQVIEQALPVLAGFTVGVPVGMALVWWMFL